MAVQILTSLAFGNGYYVERIMNSDNIKKIFKLNSSSSDIQVS